MKYIGDVDDIASNKWEQHPDNVPCVLSPDPLHKGFIALGENGEYQNVKVDVKIANLFVPKYTQNCLECCVYCIRRGYLP